MRRRSAARRSTISAWPARMGAISAGMSSGAVLVVGVGVDDHVGARLQAGVEPGHEGARQPAGCAAWRTTWSTPRACARPRPCRRCCRRRSTSHSTASKPGTCRGRAARAIGERRLLVVARDLDDQLHAAVHFTRAVLRWTAVTVVRDDQDRQHGQGDQRLRVPRDEVREEGVEPEQSHPEQGEGQPVGPPPPQGEERERQKRDERDPVARRHDQVLAVGERPQPPPGEGQRHQQVLPGVSSIIAIACLCARRRPRRPGSPRRPTAVRSGSAWRRPCRRSSPPGRRRRRRRRRRPRAGTGLSRT